MAEVFSYSEGSAYVWTGNSTTSALLTFTRGVRIGLSVTRHSYRPPFSAARVWTELERQATLNVGMAYSEKTALKFLTEATGGQVHCHVTHLVPNVGVSGGFFMYTGTLADGNFAGTEGQGEQAINFNATFERWTGY